MGHFWYKGVNEEMDQLQIWAAIAQAALNYIFVSAITSNGQKATVTDVKTDLRTTKEDLMNELKDSRENLLTQNEISMNSIIDILTAEIKKNGEGRN